MDTLRADHLGVYGYRRNTSPNIDRFAREGILFRQAFAHAPETNPSLSSLFTSHYPHETKVLVTVLHVLPSRILTLAEILKAKGYRTAAIVSNASLKRGSGFEQGFDVYDDHMEDRIVTSRWGRLERIAPKTTRAAITWLEGSAKKQQPFFLWVHYMDPHGPYTPPAPYHTMFVEPSGGQPITLPVNRGGSGKGGIPVTQRLGAHRDPAYYIAQYDGEIRFLDEALGELLAKIRALGLMERSLLIFTADHGEGMGEHDYYFAHGEFLYNELLHVPLLLRLPGASGERKEVRVPVAQVDVLPTILDILGIKTSKAFRGQSLLAPREEREIFAEVYPVEFTKGNLEARNKYMLMVNDLKLIWGADYSELYDLRTDGAETVNLMNDGMDATLMAQVADLTRRLQAILQQDALALGDPIRRALDEKLSKQLRALGYVQ